MQECKYYSKVQVITKTFIHSSYFNF